MKKQKKKKKKEKKGKAMNKKKKKKKKKKKNGKDGKALNKWINDAVHDKITENLRNRIDVRLVSNKK